MMLDAFDSPGRFYRGNLHGHSTLSDGALDIAAVGRLYRDAGYDFIAVTDHFRARYGYPIADSRPIRAEGFTTLIGAELHALATEAGAEWHLLAVGLPLDFAPPAADETGVAIARRARAAGAFVAIAHPHWYQLSLADALSIDAAHAVEVYNHTSQLHCDRGDGLVMFDQLLSAGRRLFGIAVDDSHHKIDDALGGWVMVKAEENEPAALLAALRAGRFYASQGPEILGIAREGSALRIACSPARSVILLGPVSDNARIHGDGLTEAVLDVGKFKDTWCRLVVVDGHGRRAWTNPLWLNGAT